MPNHLHGIIVLQVDDSVSVKARKPLGRLIGAFKTISTKRINDLRDTPGAIFWQRNYWEHIIRDEGDMNRIREYIKANPMRWANDQLHPRAAPNRFNQE